MQSISETRLAFGRADVLKRQLRTGMIGKRSVFGHGLITSGAKFGAALVPQDERRAKSSACISCRGSRPIPERYERFTKRHFVQIPSGLRIEIHWSQHRRRLGGLRYRSLRVVPSVRAASTSSSIASFTPVKSTCPNEWANPRRSYGHAYASTVPRRGVWFAPA